MSQRPDRIATMRERMSLPGRVGLAERLAEAVGGRIVSGKVAPGSPLETETEIQKRHGVSRTVVREAMRLLAAKGLIVTRTKVGTSVRQPERWNMLDPEVMRWSLEHSEDDAFADALFEIRSVIEPQASKLAAERIEDKEREALRRAMEGMAAMPVNLEERVAVDLTFHHAILEATHNPILRSLGDVIEQSLMVSFSISWRVHPGTGAVDQHRAVFDAIMAGDGEAARLAMAGLVDSARQDVLEGLSKRRGQARAVGTHANGRRERECT